jgi:hypothetical protein
MQRSLTHTTARGRWRAAAAAAGVAAAAAAAAAAAPRGASAQPIPADEWAAPWRNWTYYPDWIIPPSCVDTATCSPPYVNVPGAFSDLFQTYVNPLGPAPAYLAVYTFFDGVGYQVARAFSDDLVHFTQPLSPGGIVFTPRGQTAPGDFDYGSTTFVGPLYTDYNVTAPRALARVGGKFWTSYIGFPVRNALEPPPGATGLASSVDGFSWTRETPVPVLDVAPAHGAQPWEQTQVYAPFLVLNSEAGTVTDYYNARGAPMSEFGEQSGVAFLPAASLPGWNATTNSSLWRRYVGNPVIHNGWSVAGNETFDTAMASDPKVFWDASLDGGAGAWVMIYFGLGPSSGGGAAICIAFSRDGLAWTKASAPLYKPGGHPAGLDKCHAHKVHLTADASGRKYLYYTGDDCHGRGILLLTSTPLPGTA